MAALDSKVGAVGVLFVGWVVTEFVFGYRESAQTTG